MKTSLRRAAAPTTFLARLIDSPELVRTIRALPAPAFAALVREVGVEDAGELVALATTDARHIAAAPEGLVPSQAAFGAALLELAAEERAPKRRR